MKILNEAIWKPVDLSSRGSSGGARVITSSDVSTNWYKQALDSGGERRKRLENYNSADMCSVLIARALDILAEDISASNADDDESIIIDYPDDSKITKTKLRNTEDRLEMWKNRTEMEKKLFDRVRNTLKYGITYYLKGIDGTLTEIPTEQIVGYVLSEEGSNEVTHYIRDLNAEPLACSGKLVHQRKMHQTQDRYEFIEIDRLVVFKVGDTPFGKSIIERVFRLWKQTTMLEDAILIYRIVRSPERRVFYVDTGNLQGAKREAVVEKQRLRLMQSKMSKSNGDVVSEYDPQSMAEDIFIPTNAQGRGSKVEVLQGGQGLGDLEDLKYFSKQLAAGLQVPHSMLDPESSEDRQFNDARVGQVYQAEMRYMGHVKRLQRYFSSVLEENFIEFCKTREFELDGDMIFRFAESMSFAQYKQMELDQAALNVFNSTTQATSMSPRFTLQRFMNLTQAEIDYNEECKLLEKGIPIDKIKTIPKEDIMNIVYGDGSKGEKYGIKSSESLY